MASGNFFLLTPNLVQAVRPLVCVGIEPVQMAKWPNHQISCLFFILDLRIFLYLGDHCPPLPLLLVSMENRAVPTFVQFVLTQKLQAFINSKGVD